MKKKIGTTVVKNNILYGLGNVRLAPHYVKHLINPFSTHKCTRTHIRFY